MHVLVVGGAGYIGSVTVEELLNAGHQVTVFDNLSHGHRASVDERAQIVIGSTEDPAQIDEAFAAPVDAVVHFAASIAVGESMEIPGHYFHNNISGTINLVNGMLVHGVKRLVFSSTAALFGDPEYVPIDEKHPLQPMNPYGESKLAVERLLRWYDERCGIKSVALRYFNASGATKKFGEDHHPETHLIPLILEVAEGKRACFTVNGYDYPTPDGTCVRDYVHVQDLAQAHILALDYTATTSGRFNLGSGTGTSNKEVVEAARRVTKHAIPIESGPRRAGDPAVLVSASQMARAELGWRPRYDNIDAIVESAWQWRKLHPNGYGDQPAGK
jgi:UDP-glucose 4-epimerase